MNEILDWLHGYSLGEFYAGLLVIGFGLIPLVVYTLLRILQVFAPFRMDMNFKLGTDEDDDGSRPGE